jgi:hypothetical protein
MTSGKYKATAAVSVLYGFETWLLLQGKESDYKRLRTYRSGKYVNVKHEESEGYYVTLDLACSKSGRSRKYKVRKGK